MKATIIAALTVLWLLPARASAQDSRLAPGVRVGAWFTEDEPWPTAVASLDWRLRDRFVFDVSYSAVHRTIVFCPGDGPDEPAECDERKTIHALSTGFRAELGSARARPYVGVFLGSTWYEHRGGLFGARGGVRYAMSDRLSVLIDGSFNALVDGDTFGGYGALTAGIDVGL